MQDGTYEFTGYGWEPAPETDGYYVAVQSVGIIPPKPEQGTDNALQWAILDALENRRVLSGVQYLGLWTAEDGRRYVDAVEWVADEHRARQMGRALNQIAVWDVANGCEIPTGGTGE